MSFLTVISDRLESLHQQLSLICGHFTSLSKNKCFNIWKYFWYFSEMEWSVSGTLSPVTIMSSYLATKIFHISSKEKICHPPSDQLKWFSKIFWILQKYFQIMSLLAAFLSVEVSDSGLVILVKNCSVYVFIVPVVKKYDSSPLSPHSRLGLCSKASFQTVEEIFSA